MCWGISPLENKILTESNLPNMQDLSTKYGRNESHCGTSAGLASPERTRLPDRRPEASVVIVVGLSGRPRKLPLRAWRNTVETLLFEISNSMKSYPSVFLTYMLY